MQINIGLHEALIYYGRALEIMEAAHYTGHQFDEYETNLLEHLAKVMTQIFEEQNCELEKERLLDRINAIQLPENS